MATKVWIAGRPEGRSFRVVNATTGRKIQTGFPSWSEAADYAKACGFEIVP